MKDYDLIIIGGGPAGLTAGIYASRAKLKTLILEKMLTGGQIATTDNVENYPGYPGGGGPELTEVMEEQARNFGTEFIMAEVKSVDFNGQKKIVSTAQGDFRAPAIIIASGSDSRKLGVTGEADFTGRGVSYCATCDGAFYEDLPVMVVGGGDAAVDEAVFLTRFASKVYIVHRRDELRATKVVQEKAFANEKIEMVWDSIVEEIRGDQMVEKVAVKNVKDQSIREIPVKGIFIYIGFLPNTGWLKGAVELDETGHIITNQQMETSVPGVYAAGDCRQKLLRQVVTATGDGATAAFAAEKYIESLS